MAFPALRKVMRARGRHQIGKVMPRSLKNQAEAAPHSGHTAPAASPVRA